MDCVRTISKNVRAVSKLKLFIFFSETLDSVEKIDA